MEDSKEDENMKDCKLLRTTCFLAFIFTPVITIAWKYSYKPFDNVYGLISAIIASTIFISLFISTYFSKFIRAKATIVLYILCFSASISLLNEAYKSNFSNSQTLLLIFIVFVSLIMLRKTSHLIIYLGVMLTSTIILLNLVHNPEVSKIDIITFFLMYSIIGYTHLKFKFDAQKELKETEALYRSLVESTLVGSFLYQKNMLIYVNPYIEKLFGYTLTELSQFDYTKLIHPDDLPLLKTVKPGESDIPLLRILKKDGSILYLEGHFTHVTYNGSPAIIGNILDITHLKNAEDKIKRMAYYDELTQLPNRYMLNDYLNETLVHINKEPEPLGILFIDLDNFKAINDTFGHKFGDLVLKEASKRLNVCIRKDDIVCRFGGDEFIIVLKKIDREECVSIAERIICEFCNEFVLNGNTVFMSPSIGICLYPQDGKNTEDLLMHADAAMYSAKENGRNNYHFFS